MASPGKSPCKPHCQLRGTINSIEKIKNDVELQSNGVSMVLTGNRALRASLNKDVPLVIDLNYKCVEGYDPADKPWFE